MRQNKTIEEILKEHGTKVAELWEKYPEVTSLICEKDDEFNLPSINFYIEINGTRFMYDCILTEESLDMSRLLETLGTEFIYTPNFTRACYDQKIKQERVREFLIGYSAILSNLNYFDLKTYLKWLIILPIICLLFN